MNDESLKLLNAIMKTLKKFPQVEVETSDYTPRYFTIHLKINWEIKDE